MNVQLQRHQWQHKSATQQCIRVSSCPLGRCHRLRVTPTQASRHSNPSGNGEGSHLTATVSLPATAALAALVVGLQPTGAVQATTIPVSSIGGIKSSLCAAVNPTAAAPRFSAAETCVAPSVAASATSALAGPAAEIPWPKAPSVPGPQTPPNSPLPTPDMPTPPFIPVPPPPSLPPQLLPPHPGNEPPPQRLIPNAPRSKIAFASSVSSSSSSSSSAVSARAAVTVSSSSNDHSSTDIVGLLKRFRQQQVLKQQWQQALLWAAFSEGGASHLTLQEPPGLPLPGDIPVPFLDQNLTTEKLSEGLINSRGPLLQGSRSAMLAMYATADSGIAADAAPAAQPAPVLAPTGATGSKVKVVVPDSGRASNATDAKGSGSARPVVSGFEGNMVSVPDGFAASNQRKGPNDRDWLQQLQQLPEAAQRDPGISDLLKALARFADASVRLAVPLLRLLVQIAAALIQALVKLIVWGLDKGHQSTVARVQDVRQQNVAMLGHQQQQRDGQAAGSMAVLANAFDEQLVAPQLAAKQA